MDLCAHSPSPSASALEISPGISRVKSIGNPLRKVRSACNRCHAQKLRCVRIAGEASSCERCSRLKTSCRFGARAARSSRRLPDQVTIETTLGDPLPTSTSIPMLVRRSGTTIDAVDELDWLSSPGERTHIDGGRVTQTNPYCSLPDFVDDREMCWAPCHGVESALNPLLAFEGSANMNFTPLHNKISNADTFFLPDTLDPYMILDDQVIFDHSDLTSSSIVQRLANLNVALYECGRKLPSPLIAGSVSVGIGTRKSKIFALDEAFRLTTEFLNIFKSLLHTAQHNLSPSLTVHSGSNVEPTLPLFTYSQGLSKRAYPDGMEEPTRTFSPLGEATVFMIMSCHCYLTEIYVSIFKMMQACIEHSIAPQGNKDWTIILPQLQVGSIASPPVQVDTNTPVSSATSSMYMLMITMLSSQVWKQLAMRMRIGDDNSVKIGARSVLTETIWQKMTDKNDYMLQTIDSTRHTLQRHNVILA